MVLEPSVFPIPETVQTGNNCYIWCWAGRCHVFTQHYKTIQSMNRKCGPEIWGTYIHHVVLFSFYKSESGKIFFFNAITEFLLSFSSFFLVFLKPLTKKKSFLLGKKYWQLEILTKNSDDFLFWYVFVLYFVPVNFVILFYFLSLSKWNQLLLFLFL